MFFSLLLLIRQVDLTKRPVLVPEPNFLQLDEGNFVLSKETTISYDGSIGNLTKIVKYAQLWIYGATGFNLTISDKPLPHGITFDKSEEDMKDEEYLLKAQTDLIKISSKSYSGWFYGFATLLQLFPPEIYNLKPEVECALVETKECRQYEWNQSASIEWKAQAVTIRDAPRFGYRGVLLDISRHFFTVDAIKRFLRVMAIHKLNQFQIHLTDDPGNRFESFKFPLFQEIGSIRKQSPKPFHPDQGDGKQYGPYFYTQEELRDLVRYSANLAINVVPDFDFPGHSLGVLAAYPQYSCRQKPLEVSCRWGNSIDVYCPGNDDTIKHLEAVLDEITTIFPSNLIHIGGDECSHQRWKTCSKCQARIKKEGLKDVEDLQAWFVSYFANYVVKTFNKRIIGWGEVFHEGLDKSTIVMNWQGIGAAVEAVKKGYNVIDCDRMYLYYNFLQFPAPDVIEYQPSGVMVSYYKAYRKDPYYMIAKENQHLVLGLQCGAWTEYIWEEKSLHYKLFPRFSALAEVAWTQIVNKNWYRHISGQVRVHGKRYPYMGVNPAPYMLKQKPLWKKEMLTTEYKSVSFNLTGAVQLNCPYQAAFIKTGGANNLKVKNVKILVNGEQVAIDIHEGTASFLPNYSAFFDFKLAKAVPTNGKVELVAEIRGDGGVDCEGELLVLAATT